MLGGLSAKPESSAERTRGTPLSSWQELMTASELVVSADIVAALVCSVGSVTTEGSSCLLCRRLHCLVTCLLERFRRGLLRPIRLVYLEVVRGEEISVKRDRAG